MIELVGVSKVFRSPRGDEIVAVDEVDLSIADGETHCLIGTSGCGKTTTLRMINRLEDPTRGSVRVAGEDVAALDPVALRRRIGYVIQIGGLFPHLSVERNVMLLAELEGWSRARRRARCDELLALVNLPPAEFRHRRPSELSGGQRQRVGVARALALDPAYVLMDEPFGALDPITRGQLHAEFDTLRRRVGKTIVLVTHDVAEAFRLGDRVSLMHEGRVVQTGTEEDFRLRPRDALVRGFVAGHFREAAHG